jgi:riboflavin synthase
MFTGIVQAMGVVRSLHRGPAGARLLVDAPDLNRPIADGASICVSGVCLTVTSSNETSIEFDVVPETLARSTLASLTAGHRVNLEPSLRAGDRMDGHIVQGHVDGTARIVDVRDDAEGRVWIFEPDRSLMPYLIPKGSVAVDGISLTIADVTQSTFSVALIPTTLSVTTLGRSNISDRVNVETDILARTVVHTLERMQSAPREPAVTLDLLRENGW